MCERLGPKLAFVGQMLFDLPLLVCSAGVVRRECIAGVGGFDPMILLMEDADIYVRVMRRYGALGGGTTETLRDLIGKRIMDAGETGAELLAYDMMNGA